LCAIAYAPFAILQAPRHPVHTAPILSMVGLTVVCTALAFTIFFALIKEVGPMRATVITYLNPAVAVVLGVVVLGESFGWATGVGFVAVLGGSFLATRSLRPAGPASVPRVSLVGPEAPAPSLAAPASALPSGPPVSQPGPTAPRPVVR
jgi:threonine/homoserine efflux transporter RhtA